MQLKAQGTDISFTLQQVVSKNNSDVDRVKNGGNVLKTTLTNNNKKA